MHGACSSATGRQMDAGSHSLILTSTSINLLTMQRDQLESAKPPFNDNFADIICVYRLILSQASLTFENILALPHPPPEGASAEDYIDGIPVIQLTEVSEAIDHFLRCCYTVVKPDIDLSHFPTIYKAREKYQADAVIQYALSEFNKLAVQPEYSLRAYAVACCIRLKPQAQLAAEETLHLSKVDLMDTSSEEMNLTPASSLSLLLEYHHCCCLAFADLCDVQYWINRYSREGPSMWDIIDGRTGTIAPCCLEDDQVVFAER